MAFQKAQSSSSVDSDDILIEMLNNPKRLLVSDVSDFKVNRNSAEGYKYFYVTFKSIEDKCEFKLSFNVKINDDDSIYIGQGAKLYPLLSFVSHISDEAIICFKSDIDDGLKGLEFEAKTIRKKFGRKPYFVLVPISEGDE